MNRRVVIVLAVFLALAALLVGYTVTHQRPRVPSDSDHLQSDDPQNCLRCHGRGQPNARSKNHPLDDKCWDCHERAR